MPVGGLLTAFEFCTLRRGLRSADKCSYQVFSNMSSAACRAGHLSSPRLRARQLDDRRSGAGVARVVVGIVYRRRVS